MTEVHFRRIRALSLMVILGGTLFIARLAVLQISRGDAFEEVAALQYVAPASDSFSRGTIFFQNKDSGLPRTQAATIKSGFTLAINPLKIGNSQMLWDTLSPLLPPLEEGEFFLKAKGKDDSYEEIVRRLPRATKDAVEALHLPGIHLTEEHWRYYPSGLLAAHTLGFVGFDEDVRSGQYGVERYYDETLSRGSEGFRVNVFAEIFTTIGSALFYDSASSREGDIVLTIDREADRFLGNELDEALKKWGAQSGGGIIIHPRTGEIYAMEARPTFDPNTFGERNDYTIFKNPLVEDVFEMGSIMKPLTIAFGLDAGVITPRSTYYDTGVVKVGDADIANYDGKARGTTPIQEILNQSLNVGAVHVMQKIGTDTFARYMSDFGFGEETGIDLPNEVRGLVGNLNTKREVEFATASFGQGFAVTPTSIVRALSAIANGGILVTPRVVDTIEYTLGSSKQVGYGDEKRVLKKETAEEVTRMLVETVDTALLGGTVKLPHWSIAAKTGTAQVVDTEGKYYEDKFLHSFFGYFPAFDPQFLVFLYIVDPHGATFASETLTGPFMDIAKFLLSYYTVPPDR